MVHSLGGQWGRRFRMAQIRQSFADAVVVVYESAKRCRSSFQIYGRVESIPSAEVCFTMSRSCDSSIRIRSNRSRRACRRFHTSITKLGNWQQRY